MNCSSSGEERPPGQMVSCGGGGGMWGCMDYCGEEDFSNTSLRFLFSAIKKSQLQKFHQKKNKNRVPFYKTIHSVSARILKKFGGSLAPEVSRFVALQQSAPSMEVR